MCPLLVLECLTWSQLRAYQRVLRPQMTSASNVFPCDPLKQECSWPCLIYLQNPCNVNGTAFIR